MKSIVKNRKAFHDYSIEEKFEAGLVLTGSEVKSLREGHASLNDAYAVTRNGQIFLQGMSIPAYKQASWTNHEERRQRILLLKKSQIKKMDDATRREGYTIIPLDLYFDDRNIVKVELGLAKGKARHDKRASEKEKDAKSDIARAMRR